MPESDDLIREAAYLVARGVRPLAIVGHCPAEELPMLRAATRVEMLSEKGVIPFVLDQGEGHAVFGFAASSWVIDLYCWVIRSRVPCKQRSRIVGLLLGYSPDAIRRFEEEAGGRLFSSSTVSRG